MSWWVTHPSGSRLRESTTRTACVRRSNIVRAQVRTLESLGIAMTPGLITSRTETDESAISVVSGGLTTARSYPSSARTETRRRLVGFPADGRDKEGRSDRLRPHGA